MTDTLHDTVKTYYGETLTSSADLQTNACCDMSAPPAEVKALLDKIHPDVRDRYYGCGLLAPAALRGARVLDLGCGAGQDVYALAQMVGPEGHVTGVDMTEAQLAVARGTEDWHRQSFGYDASNVRFIEGYLEDLAALNLEPGSFDVIVSNCVINLTADKGAVFAGAHHLLREGGEIYFSDVYADRRLPEALKADPELWGECLSGALYSRDFLQLAREAGFTHPLRVSSRPFEVTSGALADKLGAARFVSETWRLFKHPELEAEAEDYGDQARYLGGADGAETVLELEESLHLTKGEPLGYLSARWRGESVSQILSGGSPNPDAQPTAVQ
ncbi:MAG: methyltransferase domain-containing protein, partial [Mangrovicoccus sp.]